MKYRLPIRVSGYIEFENGCATGVIDTSTKSWGPLDKVTLWGEDPDVVEIIVGDMEAIEGDINIVEGIRSALPAEIEWRIE